MRPVFFPPLPPRARWCLQHNPSAEPSSGALVVQHRVQRRAQSPFLPHLPLPAAARAPLPAALHEKLTLGDRPVCPPPLLRASSLAIRHAQLIHNLGLVEHLTRRDGGTSLII